MRQALIYLKEWYKPGCVPKARPVPCPEEPDRVWTLYLHDQEASPPALPFVPVHNRNAFLEDYVHDWNWYPGRGDRPAALDYASRCMDRPVWILLEYWEPGDRDDFGRVTRRGNGTRLESGRG